MNEDVKEYIKNAVSKYKKEHHLEIWDLVGALSTARDGYIPSQEADIVTKWIHKADTEQIADFLIYTGKTLKENDNE